MCEADAHLNFEQLVQVLMAEILDQAAILLFRPNFYRPNIPTKFLVNPT